MHTPRAALLAAIAALAFSSAAFAQGPGTCAGMTVGQLASLNGFVPFQGTSSLWNTDISAVSVDPSSGPIVSFLGGSTPLHPDFGADLANGQTVGIPYQIVAGSEPKVPVVITDAPDQSDPGPMPIASDALIEGYPNPGTGDRHVLVLDKDGCWLYELFNAFLQTDGSWEASSAAVWDLTIDQQRPYTWLSADASGLPIFPGLVRYDEVAAGAINHALAFTVPQTRSAFAPPATHWAGSSTNASAPPMGMRLRLKATFDISSFSAANQVILNALKKYGMIVTDNGPSLYLRGAPDTRWNDDDLHNLATVTAADFEVLMMSPVYTAANVPTGPLPAIETFTSTPASVPQGNSVTLNWTVNDAEYNIITPDVGLVRGTSASVVPSTTTTYTLYSTNQFGRATAQTSVTVSSPSPTPTLTPSPSPTATPTLTPTPTPSPTPTASATRAATPTPVPSSRLTLKPKVAFFTGWPQGGGSSVIFELINGGAGLARILTEQTTPANQFLITHNGCLTTLAAGARCSITVQFKARYAGFATGTLKVTDDADNSPPTAGLSGFAY
jgi:hypothetical protein